LRTSEAFADTGTGIAVAMIRAFGVFFCALRGEWGKLDNKETTSVFMIASPSLFPQFGLQPKYLQKICFSQIGGKSDSSKKIIDGNTTVAA
jgi:hypothetical protein